MQKWEYQWVATVKWKQVQKLGKEGWEMVAVVHKRNLDVAYFKRPLS